MAESMQDAYFEEQYQIAEKTKGQLIRKTLVTGGLAFLFMILLLFPLPGIAYAVFSILFCAATYAVCFQEMNDGLISIVRFHPSNDSFPAMALVVTFLHAVVRLFTDQPDTHFFTAVILFSIFISMLMKLLFVREILINLTLIRDNTTYLVNVSDISMTKRYINKICTANPVIKFPNVLDTTFEGDPSELKSFYFVPAVLAAVFLFSLIFGILTGFATFLNLFFTSMSALLCICACFTGEMAFVLPYIIMQYRLRNLGSVLLGYHSVESLKTIETFLVQDTDLFPPKRNQFVEMKFEIPEYMSEAVEYTAALLTVSRSPLARCFTKATVDYTEDKLPAFSTWRCIKNYGIVASVGQDNVLLGNRSLLLSYDIVPFSQEKESALTGNDKNLLYIAINGEIAAVMIFRYGVDPSMQKTAAYIRADFSMIVETNDCNITEVMVQKRYQLSQTKIIVPDNDESVLLAKAKTKMDSDQETSAVLISTKQAIGIFQSVKQAQKLSKMIDLSILTKQASIVFGCVLTVIALCFIPTQVSGLWIFLFHLIWTVPIILLSFMKK